MNSIETTMLAFVLFRMNLVLFLSVILNRILLQILWVQQCYTIFSLIKRTVTTVTACLVAISFVSIIYYAISKFIFRYYQINQLKKILISSILIFSREFCLMADTISKLYINLSSIFSLIYIRNINISGNNYWFLKNF